MQGGPPPLRRTGLDIVAVLGVLGPDRKNVNPFDWNAPWFIVAGGLFVIVMLRANGTYWLGRGISAGTSHTRYAKLLSTPGYVKAQNWLERWGPPVVTVSFLTVGVQTLVNLAAGVGRMSMRRYLPAVIVGSVLWALLYSTIGFVGFAAVAALYRFSPALAVVTAVLVVVALVVFIVWRVRQGRRGEGALGSVDRVESVGVAEQGTDAATALGAEQSAH